MSAPDRTQKKTFWDNQVTIYVYEFKSPAKDAENLSIQEEIEESMGSTHGRFTFWYARFVAYTIEMEFNWEEEEPYYFTNLEEWWNMIVKGKSAIECYLWMTENISNDIIDELQNTVQSILDRKHRKPKREQLINAGEEAEQDPN